MSSGGKKLRGDLYMGYRAAIAHPLKKLFSRDERTGKQRFLDNYAPEGLIPTSAADREVLNLASRCIHCGLCDAYDPTISTLPRTVYDGASLLPISYSRATPDMPRARRAIEHIDPESLARAEAVCPTRVPLRRIARYLEGRLAELDALGAQEPEKSPDVAPPTPAPGRGERPPDPSVNPAVHPHPGRDAHGTDAGARTP